MRNILGLVFYIYSLFIVTAHNDYAQASSGSQQICQSLNKSAIHQGPKTYPQFLYDREIDSRSAISENCSSADLEQWPKITDREFHNQSRALIARCGSSTNRPQCLKRLNQVVKFVKSSKILVSESSRDLGAFDPLRYQSPPHPSELFICCRESHSDPKHHSLLLMDQGSPFMCQHESSRTFCTKNRKELPASGPVYEAAKNLCSQLNDEVLCPRGIPRLSKPQADALQKMGK